jgi:hypothetical protein
MVDQHEREMARADLKTAATGVAFALVVLAIVMGGASVLAIALH